MKGTDKNLCYRRAFVYIPGKKALRVKVINPASFCTDFSPAKCVFLITYLGNA